MLESLSNYIGYGHAFSVDTAVMGDIVIRNTYLPFRDSTKATEMYDVICKSGRVHAIVKSSEQQGAKWQEDQVDVGGQGLLLPSLCHAHVHLDKCFILDKCDTLITGDFEEALRVTAAAKARFPQDENDLYDRGKRLIIESVESGVTSMRAHVEVDGTVKLTCLQTALRLKKDLSDLCDIQIAAFAQDSLGSEVPMGQNSINNFGQILAAIDVDQVDVLGSAPYVESSLAIAEDNIKWIFIHAYRRGLHVDLHLDYNLDVSQKPLIWFILKTLQNHLETNRWNEGKRVTIGHATRLTMFSPEEWTQFKDIVESADLPITLVGLPQSDLYMMGRNLDPVPRGTLNVVKIQHEFGLDIAMAVNNVGNAFTPQGSADPLSLCPLGVAIFQAGTMAASHTLIESVTTTARRAIGEPLSPIPRQNPLVPQIGDSADFVLMRGNTDVQSAACNPSHDRTTVKQGRIVAERTSKRWLTSR